MRTRFQSATLFLICLFLIQSAFGVTYLYFQNNSGLAFTYATKQFGPHTMDPGEWSGAMTGNVAPWAVDQNLLWTNRDQGVHNGDDFFFDVKLFAGNDSIVLKLKLNGNFTGSDLWQSASGPGFSHPWYGDNIFHTEPFTFLGKQFTLKYTAEFTGGDDDVRFALQEESPWPIPAADDYTFDVLSYNLYMLTPPIAYTDQSERAAIIPNHIAGYDALILSEVFYNSARDSILVPGLSSAYPFHTAVVDVGGSSEDGGVMILSKWPILSSTHIVYDSCDGSDCLAAKGAMYAKIDKNGVNYHLFGTHTQAWQTGLIYRQAQFRQLRGFIDALNLPSTEAVLVGGDLNVDKILNNQNEYGAMFSILKAEEPRYQGNTFTYDPDLNLYASGSDFEFLDYVLRLSDHLKPIDSLNEVRIFRGIEDDIWGEFDLSDHFAVYGHFEFPNSVVATEIPAKKASVTATPNPFIAKTNLILELGERQDVRLQVTNSQGQIVLSQTHDQLDQGLHNLQIEGVEAWASGVYFYTCKVGNELLRGKLVKQ